MTKTPSFRPVLFAFVLSVAMIGASAATPAIFADCGTNGTHGGCVEAGKTSEEDQADETPWWGDLADLIASLFPAF